MQKPNINATELIKARGNKKRPKLFDERVAFYRKAGYSDAEIVHAMANSPLLVNALGGRKQQR